MPTNSPPSVILTDALASLNKAVNIAVRSYHLECSSRCIDLCSSRAFKIKHVKKSLMQVLKDGKRAASGMRLLKLFTSVGLRSRRGGKRPVFGRLLYVAFFLSVLDM